MYWYGWMATSALGALALAAVVTLIPESWTKRVWSGWSWAVPVAAMLFVVYLLRRYFIR
jgi:hypothetical protein